MRISVVETLRIGRVLVLVLLDSSAWILAVLMAVALRLATVTFQPVETLRESGGDIPLYGVLTVGGAAAVLHCTLAWMLRLHQGRHAMAGFEEIFALASVIIVTGTTVGIFNALSPMQFVPSTAVVVATFLALVLSAWPRALWRLTVLQARPNKFGVVAEPVVIVGAGTAGRELVSSLQRDPKQPWNPVAFIDDDPRKKHFRHQGVSVRGAVEKLQRVASLYGAETVIIAMPSVDSTVITRVYDTAREAGLNVKVLPHVSEVLGEVTPSSVRDIEPADLLGRRPVETDVSSIAGYLTGRRVLVTGAGGSIGAELCRQIRQYDPAQLIMLDRDESSLHSLALTMLGRADLESPNMVLGDIRDLDRMIEVFEQVRPEVVFHAAALKHVNMLEQQPAEAFKTNVLGTLNVLRAAAASGSERFINISTDKAANPENVLGYSKRLAEGITADFAGKTTGTFLSVRFGNVLGTRGSVLTTFTAQIAKGGPVTITDPDVTRFFMTINEAVQLVIQAAAIGRDGEALILDMGTPVRIMDVARQMIEQSGQDIDIVVTGLKPGEKLHEVLFGSEELDHRPVHPLVSHVLVPPIEASESFQSVAQSSANELITAMQSQCRSMSDERTGPTSDAHPPAVPT